MGAGIVLIVDDEEIPIRNTASHILLSYGYKCLLARMVRARWKRTKIVPESRTGAA